MSNETNLSPEVIFRVEPNSTPYCKPEYPKKLVEIIQTLIDGLSSRPNRFSQHTIRNILLNAENFLTAYRVECPSLFKRISFLTGWLIKERIPLSVSQVNALDMFIGEIELFFGID